MEKYIWLFPIIFIFHDIEEIIGFGLWLQKNRKMLAEKYPFILKTYHDFSTEGLALAVFEELIVCIGFSALALYTNVECFMLLWLGAFVACILHFIVHIGQAIIIRSYIPALITSIICLPVSVWILFQCIVILGCPLIKIVLFSFIGIVAVLSNLKFAHLLMEKFTKRYMGDFK